MSMFCYQCEQTGKGTGCTAFGVCGKDPETAALQDLLIHGVKELASYAHRARQLGVSDHDTDVFTIEVLFTTVTNVNFAPRRIAEMAQTLAALRDQAKSRYEAAYLAQHGTLPAPLGRPAWVPAQTLEALVAQGQQVGIEKRKQQFGDDVTALQELILYGLKGMAAYADHAHAARAGGRCGICLLPRGAGLFDAFRVYAGRTGGDGAESRRSQPDGDGPARCRQHRRLRPSGADARARDPGEREGDRRLRA